MSSTSRPPASGERAAITGYEQQYRASAGMILRALQRRELEWVRVADMTAGRVDDLQLATPGRLDAYQFKFGTWPGSLTLNQLLKPDKSAPPLLRSLAAGWRERAANFPDRNVIVHLSSNDIPSQRDVVTTLGGVGGEKHFAAFCSQAWERVSTGACSLASTLAQWGDTWQKIAEATGIETELENFVHHCRLDFGLRLELGPEASNREREIWEQLVSDLQTLLLRIVGDPRREIEYSAAQLSEQLGLSHELLGIHRHEFRVDEHSYEPLEETERRLNAALSQAQGGYIAITGTPGAGKSSMLTRFLRSGRSERVLRYYAYTPDEPSPGRGEAANFLSDMIGELERQGVRSSAVGPHHFDLELLRARLREQLRSLGEEYQSNGRRTLLLVDGLDHIARELHPTRSLVDELPTPSQVPAGVVILLGTQTPQAIPPLIVQSLRDEPWRRIEIAPLPPSGVRRVLRRCGLDARLDEIQISRIVELTDGHPLALGYLVAQLDAAATDSEIDQVMEAAPVFKGHIEAIYRAHWAALGKGLMSLAALLETLSWLRRPFDLSWVRKWADTNAFHLLRTQFFHYFRRQGEQWDFFHQSFRLFVQRESTIAGFCESDQSTPRAIHREIARHCHNSPIESVWRREELYHLAEAGEDVEVAAVATSDWFMSGFYRFESKSRLYEDYWLAHRSAARARLGLRVLQLALVKHELDTRFDALELQEEVVVRILLSTNRPLALHRIFASKYSFSGSAALQTAQLLLSDGLEHEARHIFLHADRPKTNREYLGFSNIGDQIYSLVEWGLTARLFLPMHEVLRSFREHHFETEERRDSHSDRENVPLDQEHCRGRVIVRFAIALLNEDDPDSSAICAEGVDWQSVTQVARQQFLLARAAAAQRAGEREGALLDLAEARKLLEKESSVGCTLQMAELSFLCGDLILARELFNEIPRPQSHHFGAGRLDNQSDPNAGFQWLRLSEALGAALSVSELLPSGGETAEGSQLMARVRIFTAQIWAAAWRGEDTVHADLGRRLSNLFRLLHQWPPNVLCWHGVRDIHEVTWQATQLTPPACAAFGPPGLRLLEAALDKAWENPETLRFWLPDNRRAIIEAMLMEGASSTWAERWIEDIERELDPATNAGGRVSECTALAEAWLSAQQPERAAASLSEALKLSFGIGYHKDDQLSFLVPLLTEHWRRHPADAESQCALIARSLHSLRHETHGGGMSVAVKALIETSVIISPKLGFETWEYNLNHGPSSFVDNLTSVLRASLLAPQRDVETLLEVLGSIVVPVAEEGDSEVTAGLFRAAEEDRGRENAVQWAERFQQQVLTRGFSRARRSWLMGLVDVGLVSSTVLEDWPENGSESSVRATREIIERLANSANLLAELRSVLEEEGGTSREGAQIHRFIGWSRIAANVYSRLGKQELGTAMDLLGEPGKEPEAILAAVERMLALGEREHAKTLALRCVDEEMSELQTFPNADNLTSAHQALTLAAPDIAGRRWFASLEDHDWLDVRQWQIACDALLDEEERKTFSGEVSRYVTALLWGCDTTTPECCPEIALDLGNQGEAMAEIVLNLTEHASGVVRHGAQRACLNLVLSQNGAIRLRLRRALKQRHFDRSTFLVILIAAARSNPDTVQHFWEDVEPLHDDPEADVRHAVEQLGELLLRPTTRYPKRAATLNPTYNMSIPPPFDPGIAVKLYGSKMELVARHCGISLSNLLQRLQSTHLQILDSTLQQDSERSLEERLRDTGLEYLYRNESARAAERATMRILAELHDSGLIAPDDLRLMIEMFGIKDSGFIGASPEARPISCFLCQNDVPTEAWSEEWLNAALPPDLGALWRIYPGWRILGAEHCFKVFTDHRPEEQQWCLATPSALAEPSSFDRWQGPFVPAATFSSDDYFGAQLDGSGLVMRAKNPKDMPSRPWLALVPELGFTLKWQPAKLPWFSWNDRSGRLVARSVWWMDGPVTYFGRSYSQTAAEGWAVIVSEAGWESIKDLHGPLRINHWIERRHCAAENGIKSGPRLHQDLMCY